MDERELEQTPFHTATAAVPLQQVFPFVLPSRQLATCSICLAFPDFPTGTSVITLFTKVSSQLGKTFISTKIRYERCNPEAVVN